MKDDLGNRGFQGLRTGIIRSLVDFKSIRKYQPKDSPAQNYKLVELQAMLAAARSELLPANDQDNTMYPTLRDLMLFIKNSGAIVVREFPSTFKSFLLQLSRKEMDGIVSIENLEILARNDVLSTQKKADYQRVLTTVTQASTQDKIQLRAFIQKQFPKFWTQGRQEAIEFMNQPENQKLTINVNFTEQCIKDLNRAQSSPVFVDILYFLRNYLNQDRLPQPKQDNEIQSYQTLLRRYDKNLRNYRKSFFNGKFQPLPPNLHTISLKDYQLESWYGYALLNFIHQGNHAFYGQITNGWFAFQFKLLGTTMDMEKHVAMFQDGYTQEILPDPVKKEVVLVLRSGLNLTNDNQRHTIQDITLKALFGFDVVRDPKDTDKVVALVQTLKGLDYQF